jgi:hypothetical protein
VQSPYSPSFSNFKKAELPTPCKRQKCQPAGHKGPI